MMRLPNVNIGPFNFDPNRATASLALLGVLGYVAAGCGSSSENTSGNTGAEATATATPFEDAGPTQGANGGEGDLIPYDPATGTPSAEATTEDPEPEAPEETEEPNSEGMTLEQLLGDTKYCTTKPDDRAKPVGILKPKKGSNEPAKLIVAAHTQCMGGGNIYSAEGQSKPKRDSNPETMIADTDTMVVKCYTEDGEVVGSMAAPHMNPSSTRKAESSVWVKAYPSGSEFPNKLFYFPLAETGFVTLKLGGVTTPEC